MVGSIEAEGVMTGEVLEAVEEEVALETGKFDIVEGFQEVNVERNHSSRNVDQYRRTGDKYFS